jgi:uncharacterized repeat protein (TIGR01451 family)
LSSNINKIGILGIVSVLTVLTGIAVSGVLQSSRTISSSGTIKAIGVEVYWDQGGTNPVTSVDWGNPEPGDTLTRTIYVENTGNSQMTLSLVVSNWSPTGAADYITVTWDRDDYQLGAGDMVEAILTLQVSPDINGIENFSFDMVIEGTG